MATRRADPTPGCRLTATADLAPGCRREARCRQRGGGDRSPAGVGRRRRRRQRARGQAGCLALSPVAHVGEQLGEGEALQAQLGRGQSPRSLPRRLVAVAAHHVILSVVEVAARLVRLVAVGVRLKGEGYGLEGWLEVGISRGRYLVRSVSREVSISHAPAVGRSSRPPPRRPGHRPRCATTSACQSWRGRAPP